MSSDYENRDDLHERDERSKRRIETLWRVGTVLALVVWLVFLVSIIEDNPGPVCGTGQDKGPC
ncbi:hypothetical protein ABZ532_08685 [Streptomyces sp. NPDC019396]|uniref:hypothetical protein n=1 Tax=Streptomyces sp. NPDC019396 TaxID=3154687 RepID=UPI0033C9BFF8